MAQEPHAVQPQTAPLHPTNTTRLLRNPWRIVLAVSRRTCGLYKRHIRRSKSSCFEDLEIIALLGRAGKRNGQTSYLEIGAWDPVAGSNTYMLYTKGARGVLIEPNPDLVEKLERLRPGDVVLNIGVSDREDMLPYYRFESGDSNTFSAKNKDLYIANGVKLRDCIQVQVRPVMEIVKHHFGPNGPDVLSVDAEGYDYRILRSWDWVNYRPSVVITEIYLYGTVEEASIELLESKGYCKHKQAGNNWIFREAS